MGLLNALGRMGGRRAAAPVANAFEDAGGQSVFGRFQAPAFQRAATGAAPDAGPARAATGFDAMYGMGDQMAMRNQLQQLRQQRKSAQDAEELADIDDQINSILDQIGM